MPSSQDAAVKERSWFKAMQRSRKIKSSEAKTAEGLDLLAVENIAKAILERAKKQVESLARKRAELEEEYRVRREELSEEYRRRREELKAEIEELRRRAEEELSALREEVKREAKKQAFEEGYQEGFIRGREEGFEEGKKAGLQKALEEAGPKLDETIRVLQSVASELHSRQGALLRDAERDVLRLALAIAEKVVKHEIRNVPEVVLRNVKKALEIVAQRTGAIIEVNPDDIKLVEEHAPQIASIFREGETIKFMPNPSVQRGGCVVRAGGCGADLQIDTQLELMEQALLGQEERGEETKCGEGAWCERETSKTTYLGS